MAHQELSLNINIDSSDAKAKVITISEAMKQLGFNITTTNAVISEGSEKFQELSAGMKAIRQASEHFIEYQEVIQSH